MDPAPPELHPLAQACTCHMA